MLYRCEMTILFTLRLVERPPQFAPSRQMLYQKPMFSIYGIYLLYKWMFFDFLHRQQIFILMTSLVFAFYFVAKNTNPYSYDVTNEVTFWKICLFASNLVFFVSISLHYVQKHITAVGS